MSLSFPTSPTVGQGYQGFVWDGSKWTATTSGLPPTVRPGGRLSYVSATALQFVPFNGSHIVVNGVFYAIPAAGIAGLATTGVYVDGTASQNLAASTLYWVYCFNNAGVLTADFCTTGHSTSATAGNVGTEIKSGDDTRTLIGLVRTSTVPVNFADAVANRLVRSWVNRQRVGFELNGSVSGFGSGAWTNIAIVGVVCFADDLIDQTVCGYLSPASTYNVYAINGLDGGQVGQLGLTWQSGNSAAVSVRHASTTTEGYHTVSAMISVAGSTMNANLSICGTIG
jgi:hypothetical protein